MASNLISRLLPPAGSPSIYETMKEYASDSDTDIEERAGLVASRQYRDDPSLDSALNAAISGTEHLETEALISPVAGPSQRPSSTTKHRKVRQNLEPDEADDDVPPELLAELDRDGSPVASPELPAKSKAIPKALPPLPKAKSPAADRSGAEKARWDATQRQQRLHRDPSLRPVYAGRPPRRRGFIADPKEKAMWRWTNVQNLDLFLSDVYEYYFEKGIYSIILRRSIQLLTFPFVVGFSLFLVSCIDYRSLRDSTKMTDIYVEQCATRMPFSSYVLIWCCAMFWLVRLVALIRQIPAWKRLHDFYLYLLEIPDIDIQTVSWPDVVKRLMSLRDSNPVTAKQLAEGPRRFLNSQSKERMDAHDIANRLMRRDNYLIAMINKDTLNLSLNFPFIGDRSILSGSLQYNLDSAVLDYIFDDRGQVKPIFLKDTQRRALSQGLRTRFFMYGIINVFSGPVVVTYHLLMYFFKNVTQYRSDPASIGSRQYTPYARWKFREFNELPHLFEQRVNMSYPFASRYINQFPKDKINQVAHFVAFVSGALTAVLALMTALDPELFLGFEITSDKTVLFYLTLFSGIWAFARGQVHDETIVFDPEWTMNDVIHFTHYEPSSWKGRLHSDEVRKDDRIIDFVREFTVHVDGLGHVCSFAVFNFSRGQGHRPIPGTRAPGPDSAAAPHKADDPRDDYYATRDNKMLASYYNFMDHYAPPTQPPPRQGGIDRDRTFHPPPNFPGLTSSHMMRGSRAEDNGPYGSRSRFQSSAQQRTPRFAPTSTTIPAAAQSGMTSILLDPHHQPESGVRSSYAAGQRSRYGRSHLASSRRKGTGTVGDLIEDEEGERGGELGPDSGSGEGEVSGELGESWMVRAREESELEDDTEEDDQLLGLEGGIGRTEGGTLGLVYQIVREQTDGRGMGGL